MNINGLNNVQNCGMSSDFQTKQKQKITKKNTPKSDINKEQKKQIVNAQNALAYTIPKNNLLFKGSYQDEEISYKDFLQIQKKYYEKFKKIHIVPVSFDDKNTIKLLNKILHKNDDVLDNTNFLNEMTNVIQVIQQQEQYLKSDVKTNIAMQILDKNDKLLKDEEFMRNAANIIIFSKTKEQAEVATKFLKKNDELLKNENFTRYASFFVYFTVKKEQAEVAMKIAQKSDEFLNNKINLSLANDLIKCSTTKELSELCINILENIDDTQQLSNEVYKIKCDISIKENPVCKELNNFDEAVKKVEEHRKKVFLKPELYVNGETDDEGKKIGINYVFSSNYSELAILASAFDDKTMNAFLRTRFSNVSKYCYDIKTFSNEDIKLLSELVKSTDNEGNKFREKEKIRFIDLISAYKNLELDMSIMHKMAKNKKVNLNELNNVLFETILKKCSIDDISQIPQEKLESWDKDYMPLLAKEIEKDKYLFGNIFSDLINAANLQDFIEYIHSNKYGKINANTQKEFEKNNMNYEAWLNPTAKEITLGKKAVDILSLDDIANKTEEEMNKLMITKEGKWTPAGGCIKKHFQDCIKNNKFIIPDEIKANKADLCDFMNRLLFNEKLQESFNRAEMNINNTKKMDMAKKTLKIRENLETLFNEINDNKLNLTIKMWDRNPQKDLFQGNYSTCCIGMGCGNASTMPHYIMNTAFNMIEINDNATGKTIGNALCYFIKDESGKPAFVIDNIEVNNSYDLKSEEEKENGKKLRNAIIEYAANVAEKVTGQNDTSIYISDKDNINDVPINDLKEKNRSIQNISFIGDIDCEKIYMDLYGGWVNSKSDLTGVQQLLRLK